MEELGWVCYWWCDFCEVLEYVGVVVCFVVCFVVCWVRGVC